MLADFIIILQNVTTFVWSHVKICDGCCMAARKEGKNYGKQNFVAFHITHYGTGC